MRDDNDLLRAAERWLAKEKTPRSQVFAAIFLIGVVLVALHWVKFG